jgi:hypothetical protein
MNNLFYVRLHVTIIFCRNYVKSNAILRSATYWPVNVSPTISVLTAECWKFIKLYFKLVCVTQCCLFVFVCAYKTDHAPVRSSPRIITDDGEHKIYCSGCSQVMTARHSGKGRLDAHAEPPPPPPHKLPTELTATTICLAALCTHDMP